MSSLWEYVHYILWSIFKNQTLGHILNQTEIEQEYIFTGILKECMLSDSTGVHAHSQLRSLRYWLFENYLKLASLEKSMVK